MKKICKSISPKRARCVCGCVWALFASLSWVLYDAFVTMDQLEDAERCIKYLNRSTLEGRMITVEKNPARSASTNTILPFSVFHGDIKDSKYHPCTSIGSFRRFHSRILQLLPCARA